MANGLLEARVDRWVRFHDPHQVASMLFVKQGERWKTIGMVKHPLPVVVAGIGQASEPYVALIETLDDIVNTLEFTEQPSL